MSDFTDVLFSQRGKIGFILLNRPRALNALTREMCVAVKNQLDLWAEDPGIDAVIIEGEGEKAFCAGGDVVKVAQSAKEGSDDCWQFFRDEYRMNSTIGHFPKPYIALLDGVTMGGGVGISAHGPYRVATEQTLFAMPETALGLIPDVGGSHILPRLPNHMGMYLALTGARLKAADMLHLGLATHYIPRGSLIDLKAKFAESQGPLGLAEVGVILDDAAQDPGTPTLAGRTQQISQHFSKDSVGAIIDSLAKDTSQWAQNSYKDLLAKSPISLELSFAAGRKGASLDLDGCLQMEYRVVNRILELDTDFFEGVRAILIDKDRNPTWSPARLADLDKTAIAAHFADLGDRELDLG
ncbi:enoyl-CoA hydratase [Iodidimonas gelatinilytica]|uniref:3-hydroxyisobutyryl-CoA hydrolase n=1 Tax=Iodidimonas gelatinilytica TaxID=1236966 RepID=A0A5A7MT29_9PROT|nr:enoyl-CoA hydratase [Iodidimonas gelatinilytica]